jgi:hypothetical protein
VCGVAVLAVFQAAERDKSGWIVPFAIVALLFNPIFPVHLNREIWAFVDVGVAALLLVSIVAVNRVKPPG